MCGNNNNNNNNVVTYYQVDLWTGDIPTDQSIPVSKSLYPARPGQNNRK